MKNCVRPLRRGLDLSQEELAVAVGVGRHTIIDIEKGEREPSASLALRIAKFFEKDPRDIFFIDDDNYIQHQANNRLEGADDCSGHENQDVGSSRSTPATATRA